MDSSELRAKFLEFFRKNGHKIIPSASLIPENDPTVLFTTAGMHPLVPYLLGEKHPAGKRLVSCQKCIRTGDIDEVGDDVHLTFFEMLGNWSLGDYWKEDAIKWSFEFLTRELKIPLEKLAISCFAGDKDAEKDEESAKIWESLGVKKERIAFLGKKDNWWGPAGKIGPCGPDTEMFCWSGGKEAPEKFNPEDKQWVEIWNDVFMQYIKDENGNYLPAKRKNVDTGMGLERTLAVLNEKESVYETDLFEPIINILGSMPEKSKRIVVDHMRAVVFLIADGIKPSNKKQGYILRRLMRRVSPHLREHQYLEATKGPESFKDWISMDVLAERIIKQYSSQKDYSYLLEKKENILSIIVEEGLKFDKVYNNGNKISLRLINNAIGNNSYIIKGKDIFDLVTTHGFSVDWIKDMADDRGVKLDFEGFEEEFKKHQELSRTASAGMFKGGLADASLETTKLHTAAHLMLAGLRKVLGEHVVQKGSNITAERLRFDFSHKEKMTSEQIKDVENFVNDIIKKDLPVTCEEMTLEKARELNAMGIFESKYGDKVKVYTIGSGENIVSREICGGPHVERTGILGHFKIQKEESSSAGVRRIKAILEQCYANIRMHTNDTNK